MFLDFVLYQNHALVVEGVTCLFVVASKHFKIKVAKDSNESGHDSINCYCYNHSLSTATYFIKHGW